MEKKKRKRSRKEMSVDMSGDPSVAIGYLRVSTDDQGLGLEAQRKTIANWASTRDVTVVGWFVDEDVSGSVPMHDRPAFMEALDSLSANGAGKVMVARRDRLARDVFLAATAEGLARKKGAVIISAAGEGTGEDPDDPTSTLLRQMVDVIAAYERGVIRLRVTAALRVLRDQGLRYGNIPYGMKLDPTDEEKKRLVVCPDESRIIARAFELSEIGCTAKEVEEALREEGHRSRAGTPFRINQVRRLIDRGTRDVYEPPEGFEQYLSDYGPAIIDNGATIGWGFKLVSFMGQDKFAALKNCGDVVRASPGELNGEWYFVVRWLTPSEAVGKFGSVTRLQLGPRGGYNWTEYGEQRLDSRKLDPRTDPNVDVPESAIHMGTEPRRVR